ncbi:Protein shisa-4 [Chionoecetes opilio]|uniref:Protein shisa-4 n=1 Tax=Chionoecetes opilio TaxID=41210 RepID=A0A8J4YGJ4_CHIOP|nr:Protein shisa-4 [Chionoecetes opilio]
MDTFGKWSNGFPCPRVDNDQPVYCCGTDHYKYCCTKRDMHALSHDIPQLPLVLGVVFGVAVAVIVIVVVSCFHCSCCLLYKKRQPTNGGPLYQMHCPSTASGVANMYSFSGTTTPSETPRSISRSHGTVESGPTTNNHVDHSHHLLEGDDGRSGLPMYSERRAVNLRPVSMSDRSSNSDGGPGPMELPPPYCAPHSTLVAVRTAGTTPAQRPCSPMYAPSNSPYVIGGGEGVYASGPLATFPQTFLSPVSPARPLTIRTPPTLSQGYAPALTASTRPCSTAHIIHNSHPGHDDHLYTATKF